MCVAVHFKLFPLESIDTSGMSDTANAASVEAALVRISG
jgi:hypothetical protein